MKIYNCRLCLGELSQYTLKLADTPLANEFVKEPSEQKIYPLEVCRCLKCGHYQLNEQICAKDMFSNYVYVSGTSAKNVEHFKDYAIHVTDKLGLKENSRVLDIASNDGTLLNEFNNLGMSTLGIDPAESIAATANEAGINTLCDFFTESYADKMLAGVCSGKFDLITANNVFAHVHDLIDFTRGVKKLLKPKGVFVFEVSYFVNVCDNLAFDTIYHEHSSYHTVTPLISFFKSHGMKVFDVERIPNHGGSIRVFVRLNNSVIKSALEAFDWSDTWLKLLVQSEAHMQSKVESLQLKVKKLGYDIRVLMQQIKKDNKTIAIYGMPAKATTLLYSFQINPDTIEFAVDDNPLKQDTYSPGMHIPVYPVSAIYEKNPDYLFILAWNFADSIIKNNPDFKGKWVIPIPELVVK